MRLRINAAQAITLDAAMTEEPKKILQRSIKATHLLLFAAQLF